jgi:hypothetical protein
LADNEALEDAFELGPPVTNDEYIEELLKGFYIY